MPMRDLSRPLARSALLMSLILACAPVLAQGNDFDRVVRLIESRYHARQTHIPLLGLARFAVKIVHPAGVKSFKLATFENQGFSKSAGDGEFLAELRRTLSNRWQPLVEQSSRQGGDQVSVFARGLTKAPEILVVSLSPHEALVAQAKIFPETFAKWIDDPGTLGRGLIAGLRGSAGYWGAKDRDDLRAGSWNAGGNPVSANPAAEDHQGGGSVADQEPTAGHVASEVSAQERGSSARPKPVLRARPLDESPAVEEAQPPSEATRPEKAGIPPERDAAEDAIRLDGQVVNLNVRATDRKGRALPDLKKENFLIYEDGVKQEVAFFHPVTSPVSVVLLLDLSTSTAGKSKVLKKAAEKFVDSLRRDDQIAVAVFTRRFTVVSRFTRDHKLLKQRIGSLHHHGAGTAYYDAMWATMDLLKEATGTRKAMVVLTDGVDNSLENPGRWPTNHPFDEILTRAAEEDTTIYPIYLDTEYDIVIRRHLSNSAAYAAARKQLDQVAEQTGGVLYRAARIEELEGVYPRVASELHALYSLAYVPTNRSNQPGWRVLSVKVDRLDAVARTRRGYLAR